MSFFVRKKCILSSHVVELNYRMALWDKMTERIRRKKSQEKLLLEIVQQNIYFLQFTDAWYEQEECQLELLREILWGMEHGREEEVIQKIYLYGSMVKDEDLIARQLFLWLIEIMEYRRQYRNEKLFDSNIKIIS